MNRLKISVKFTNDGCTQLRQGSAQAGGYDLATIRDEHFQIGEIKRISTGVFIEFPSNISAHIIARSSTLLKGLICYPNLIDPDYRGEIFIILHNVNPGTVTIEKYKYIAQLELVQCINNVDFLPTSCLNITKRNTNGFGSSNDDALLPSKDALIQYGSIHRPLKPASFGSSFGYVPPPINDCGDVGKNRNIGDSPFAFGGLKNQNSNDPAGFGTKNTLAFNNYQTRGVFGTLASCGRSFPGGYNSNNRDGFKPASSNSSEVSSPFGSSTNNYGQNNQPRAGTFRSLQLNIAFTSSSFGPTLSDQTSKDADYHMSE